MTEGGFRLCSCSRIISGFAITRLLAATRSRVFVAVEALFEETRFVRLTNDGGRTCDHQKRVFAFVFNTIWMLLQNISSASVPAAR